MNSCPAPERLIAADRGELLPAERADLEAHLEICPRCRDELRLIDALRQGLVAHGVTSRHADGHECPDEMTIARFADGRLPGHERDGMVRHLVRCRHCLGLLEAAMLEASELETRAVPEPVRGGGGFVPWLRAHLRPQRVLAWGAPALAAAIVLVAVISPGLQTPVDLAELARIEPLPVRHLRGETDPHSFEAVYRQALLLYDGGDYAAALPALERAHALRPQSPEPALYLGSARLLEGDPTGAREILEPIGRSDPGSGNPRVIEEARWLMGQACLRLNDRGCAVEALEGVVALEGPRRGAARAVLREL